MLDFTLPNNVLCSEINAARLALPNLDRLKPASSHSPSTGCSPASSTSGSVRGTARKLQPLEKLKLIQKPDGIADKQLSVTASETSGTHSSDSEDEPEIDIEAPRQSAGPRASA